MVIAFDYSPGRRVTSVCVAGSFNAWSVAAAKMQPFNDGARWFLAIELPAGRHAYKFVIDGREWLPDPRTPYKAVWTGQSWVHDPSVTIATSREADGHGGTNSVVHVPAEAAVVASSQQPDRAVVRAPAEAATLVPAASEAGNPLVTVVSVLLRLAGGFLMLGGVIGAGKLANAPPGVTIPWWAALLVGLFGLLLTMSGAALADRQARKAQPSADALLARDRRPPVLLLRGFDSDEIHVERQIRQHGSPFMTIAERGSFTLTFESMLASILERHGPVIAVGRPHEKLPPRGASRCYFSDTEWRERIQQLAQAAGRIVVIAGSTPGLAWELDNVCGGANSAKVVVIAPPENGKPRPELMRSWNELANRHGHLPRLDEKTLAATSVDRLGMASTLVDEQMTEIGQFLGRIWGPPNPA